MTYKNPHREFLQGYITLLKNKGVSIPILTAGFDDERTEDYIYLHCMISDDSSKNTNNFDIEVYIELIAVNATSIIPILDIETIIMALFRSNDKPIMPSFTAESSSLVGTTNTEYLSENKRYFKEVIRGQYNINQKS